ncbi:MAG: hypothetical protein RR354_06480 [Mucinivorans sp.]
MFDLYQHLSNILVDDSYIKKTYRSTGLVKIEELLNNVRGTVFPCVVAEVGADGWFDFLDANNATSVQNFYVLDNCNDREIAKIDLILQQTMIKGREILRQMQAKSTEYGSECYGIDFSRVDFAKVGPLGLNCYGYTFTINIIEQ